MKIFGRIESVGATKSGEGVNGTWNVTEVRVREVSGDSPQEAVLTAYRSREELEQMGVRHGAVGDVYYHQGVRLGNNGNYYNTLKFTRFSAYNGELA